MEPALGPPFTYSEYWLLVWSSAAVGAIIYAAATRAHPLKAAGLGLMTVPVWTAIWGFIHSIPALQDPDSFIPPRSTYRLSSTYIRTILIDIGYLGAGFLMWTHQHGFPRSIRDIATRLRGAGLQWGHGEGRSALLGWAWFPVLLGGTIALDIFVRGQAPALINGDESRVWENMTVYHAIIISAAAAFTEELVYRALLLIAIWQGLARLGMPRRWALAGAVVLQALVFGAAHGGYGTIYHVIGPTIFGLVAGWVAVRFGIWAAIILHFLVDIYAFGIHAAQNAPWFRPFLVALLLVNIATSVAIAVRWGLRRVQPPEADAGGA